MSVKFSNNSATTLSADVSAGATSFTVSDAASFPTLGSSDWTYVTITLEVIKVTAISGSTFTCSALSSGHTSGEGVELRMTAELLNDFASDTESTGTSVAMSIALGQENKNGRNIQIKN